MLATGGGFDVCSTCLLSVSFFFVVITCFDKGVFVTTEGAGSVDGDKCAFATNEGSGWIN